MLVIFSRCKIVIKVSLCPTQYFCPCHMVQKDQDVQEPNCQLDQELLREVKSSRHPVCPAHQPPLGCCYTLGPCPHIPQTQGEVSIPSFFSLTGFLNHPIIAPTHSVLIPTLSGLFFCVFSVGTFIRSIQVRLDDTLAEILTKGI